jgi:hypothetical protein
MASDLTATKSELYIAQAGTPRTLLPCPSCDNMMAVDEIHARWAIGTGQVAWDAVEVAQASHTVPGADGGTEVALECATCNHTRGNAVWDAPGGTRTARVGKRAAGRAAVGMVRASREGLAG